MIHRPFFIGDFAQIRGMDPSTILLTIGCGAVLTLSALLLFEQRAKRFVSFLYLDYVVSISLLLCKFIWTTPQSTDSIGLTGRELERTPKTRTCIPRREDREALGKEFRAIISLISASLRESAYSQFNGTMLSFSNFEGMDSDLIKRFPENRIESSDPPPSEEGIIN